VEGTEGESTMRQESPSFAARTDPRPGQVSRTRQRIFRASYSARPKCVTEGERGGGKRRSSKDSREISRRPGGNFRVRVFTRSGEQPLRGLRMDDGARARVRNTRRSVTRCHSREKRWERGREHIFRDSTSGRAARRTRKTRNWSTSTAEGCKRIHPSGLRFKIRPG